MKYSDLSSISFGQILAFLKVAELNSFTAAANILHVSQPVISKRIAALETLLDMSLLLRQRNQIRLTPAGRIIYDSWSRLLTSMTESVNKAYIAQVGRVKRLSIAYCASYLLKGCGEHFRSLNPDVEILYTKLQYPEMLSKLLNGDIDIAVYGSFAEPDILKAPFNHAILATFPMHVCCHPDHPFAKRKRINVSDLRTQEFIMLSPEIAPMWSSMVTNMCLKKMFYPKVVMYVEDVASLAMNTYGDERIFITDCNVSYDSFGLIQVPLIGVDSGIMGVWNSQNLNEEIPRFVHTSTAYLSELKAEGKLD